MLFILSPYILNKSSIKLYVCDLNGWQNPFIPYLKFHFWIFRCYLFDNWGVQLKEISINNDHLLGAKYCIIKSQKLFKVDTVDTYYIFRNTDQRWQSHFQGHTGLNIKVWFWLYPVFLKHSKYHSVDAYHVPGALSIMC